MSSADRVQLSSSGVDRAVRGRLLAWLRRHWLFIGLLVVGLLLRVSAMIAYRPALLAFDSRTYLELSIYLEPRASRPAGYPAFLRGLRALTSGASLGVIPVVQHTMGLGVAVLWYACLCRLRVRRWLAALAVAPLLLDAYWIDLEHHVMAEALFLALVAAGCAAILWRAPPSLAALLFAGMALACATLTRTIGLILLLPAAAAALALAGPGSRIRSCLAFLLAALIPLAAYAAWYHDANGRYALGGLTGQYLYSRVSTFVDCAELRAPAEERPLCPDEPVGARAPPDFYRWSPESPYMRVPADSRNELARRFAKRAIAQQPFAYVKTIASDVLRGFAPTRASHPGEALARWQFQPQYPVVLDDVLCRAPPGPPRERRCAAALARKRLLARRFGDHDLRVDGTLARGLTTYRRFAYVPGPVLALALVIGALGALRAGLRGDTRLSIATFLMTAVPTILIVGPIAVSHFGWRYQILALALVPIAGALGITALIDREERASGPAVQQASESS